MKLFKKIICLLTVCFIACGIALAQQPKKDDIGNEYRLVNWNSENGLIYGRVTCMLKDKNGFLWIGTEKALNRFDGSIFKNYLNPESKNQRTIGNLINNLVEDSLHNIWVGTDKGLSRYDIKADTFKNFLPDSGFASYNTSIVPFWATKTQLLCIESNSIISSYDIHSLTKRILARLSQKIRNNSYIPLPIFDAKDNCIWMLPIDPEGGLLQVSLLNGQQVRYNWPDYKNKSHISHFSEGMCYDRQRNSIWMNAVGGLMQFTLADKQFHNVNGLNDFFNIGAGIGVDVQDRIWVGTGNKGIFIYDPATGTVNQPFAGDSILQKEANLQNYRIFCDHDGTTWLGYWVSLGKGINQLIPFSKVVYRYPGNTGKPNAFNSTFGHLVQKSNDNKIWIDTGDGLTIFYPNTGLFSLFRAKDLSGIDHNKTFSFLGVGRTAQKAWVQADQTGGLFELDVTNKKCGHIMIKDTENRDIVHIGLAEPVNIEKNETIFLGTVPGGKQFLFKLDKESSVLQQVPGSLAGNITSLATDGCHLLFMRRRGPSTNLTYTFVNGAFKRTFTAVDSIDWNNIVFDKTDQTFWVGAFMQLIHYNKNLRVIRRYAQKDGLPVINVSGIQPDNDGNIWFNTERSISRLNPETGKIITLSEKEGWQEQPYHGSPVVKDNAGDLYFFGFDGLDRIKPDNLRVDYPPSSIYLKSLEISQNTIPLLTGVNDLRHLSLKYFQNRISIETGIIDYYSKGSSRIRYKLELEGKNENWQYGPSNYIIRFEGLQPGNYTLRIQASNAALQFNGPEKVLIIKIDPPWWQTYWAWTLSVVLFLATVYAFIAYRSRKLIREKHVLEEKVTVRTKQLSEANKELSEKQEEITTQRDQLSVTLTDLKATQKQLIQSEKMASLGELTAGIAHEIQNPLNFVNNFSDVSLELLDEMETELNKGDKEEAMAIAGDIRQNLEKINQHGKRADGIVKGMLQHSKSGSGVKEPTDINPLADEYMRLAYHGLRSKDKTFSAEMVTCLDSNLPKVNIVPQDMGRILLNLFNNAFYAVNQKKKTAGTDYKPEVTLTTALENELVVIKVKDNGVGIPEAIKEKIMQPFFTTKPTGEGTGLGLSLTYDMVVKGYGGSIAVDSKEGGFTEFIVKLPLS
jgi:signal transduction histidine kinase/ligand-binding sensor domain-containing protein